MTARLTRRLAALGALVCLMALAGGTARARAATAGIVPPRTPAANCNARGRTGVAAIDGCRAAEGVGPLRLPRNWRALTPVQQGFVLIDLERVNRGLPPIVGLSAPLNRLAASGAAANSDPPFPADVAGGGIWAGVPSALAADYLWMYDDGPGGDNLDCRSSSDSGCWGHRDNILWDRTSGPLVSGGGFAHAGGGNGSFAYLVLSGYSTARLTFSWARELSQFAARPRVEPLRRAGAARRQSR